MAICGTEVIYFLFRISDFEMYTYENINLIFGGIDTYADVVIAKKQLQIDNNMFLQQILDVKECYTVSTTNFLHDILTFFPTLLPLCKAILGK